MPELPEVETIRRGLALRTTGRRLARVEVRRPDLRRPFPDRLAARLCGRRIERVDRRAKYLLLMLDDGMALMVHLGMSGRIVVSPSSPGPPGRHDHLVLQTDDGAAIVYNDARRFGMVDLVPAEGLAAHPALAGLGPEPLGPAFTPVWLAGALAGRASPVKAVLIDQRVVAGLGNIYASEALFRAGISPQRLAASVGPRRAERLAAAIRSVLEDAIAAGGSSLRDYVQADGELGYFQHRWAVYDREGLPCPGCTCRAAAGGGIRRIVQAGRSTFYCARRQR
jgi:formamidopyrimidine-DNA glycosylase